MYRPGQMLKAFRDHTKNIFLDPENIPPSKTPASVCRIKSGFVKVAVHANESFWIEGERIRVNVFVMKHSPINKSI